ncbi:MAG: glycosyltransferase family 2 protein, partial [Ruminococcus sp.]
MPKFSVIIPVYNVQKYLDECVDSVLNQTYSNFEIILVDDGSTDRSPRICDCYAKKDDRIKVIHKENGGLSSARNCGIRAMTGDYVLFLDSDDFWDNKKALDSLSKIIYEESADVVCYGYKEFDENTNESKNVIFIPEVSFNGLSNEDRLQILLSNGIFTSSAGVKGIKTELFTEK